MTINMFFKAALCSAICVSGMTVAVAGDGKVNKVQNQLLLEQRINTESKDDDPEDILIPTAGCQDWPCPELIQ